MIWHPRGKDASGAENHTGVNVLGAFLTVTHESGITDLYRLVDGKRRIIKAFMSNGDARKYVDGLK